MRASARDYVLTLMGISCFPTSNFWLTAADKFVTLMKNWSVPIDFCVRLQTLDDRRGNFRLPAIPHQKHCRTVGRTDNL
jgi:hypothetical protein